MIVLSNETLHRHGMTVEEALAVAREAGLDTTDVVIVNKVGYPLIAPRATHAPRGTEERAADFQSEIAELLS